MKAGWKKFLGLAVALFCFCIMGEGTVLAASQGGGHTVTPLTAAMVATCPVSVYAQVDGTDEAGKLETGQVVNVCGLADSGRYEIVYGMGICYVDAANMTEVPVDTAMKDALAAQAEAIRQYAAAQAQAAAQQAAQAAQQAAQAAAQQQAQAAAAAQQQAALQTAAQNVVPGSGNLIFVGDSRTGQMGNAVGGPAAWPGTAFVSCYGGGVEWLSTPQAKKDIDQYVTPGSVIIINYGVNDLSKHNEYIAVINRYSQEWRSKGATVFFATVGPVGENQYGKRNWAVEYFNNQLAGRLDGGIGRIDLYGYLTAAGYQTTSDGLHYTPATYAVMFRFLMQSVGRV